MGAAVAAPPEAVPVAASSPGPAGDRLTRPTSAGGAPASPPRMGRTLGVAAAAGQATVGAARARTRRRPDALSSAHLGDEPRPGRPGGTDAVGASDAA